MWPNMSTSALYFVGHHNIKHQDKRLNFSSYKLFFRWTFHLYDLNGDGVITRDEMEDVTASVDSNFHLGISCWWKIYLQRLQIQQLSLWHLDVWSVECGWWHFVILLQFRLTLIAHLQISWKWVTCFTDLRVDGGDNRGGTQPSWTNNYYKQGGRCL